MEKTNLQQEIRKYAKRIILVNNNVNVNVAKKGQKGKRSEIKDWWERSFLSKKNSKRKTLKGSTDVCILKRTIELEID